VLLAHLLRSVARSCSLAAFRGVALVRQVMIWTQVVQSQDLASALVQGATSLPATRILLGAACAVHAKEPAEVGPRAMPPQ